MSLHYNTSSEATTFDDYRDTYLQAASKRFNEQVLSRETLLDTMGGSQFDYDSPFK
jgi:hypothetical protein